MGVSLHAINQAMATSASTTFVVLENHEVDRTGSLSPSLGIAFLVIGVIVFACSLVALRRAEMFGAGSRFALAICTAALSVIGLWRLIAQQHGAASSHEETSGGNAIDGILIPYIALALTLLLLPLILFVGFCLRILRKRWSSRTPCSNLLETTDRDPSRGLACRRKGDRLSGRNREADKHESGGPWI